jgi:Tol biopolymer transport system component
MKFLSPQNDAQLKQLSIMNPDGTNLRNLTGALPGMTNLGSPEFSHDGKQIALDMSQGSTTSSRIIVLNTDGTDVRDLGPGCMPSFSPDGKRIALTQSGAGIVLMDSDGTNREVIEPRGWGVQYSPDGQSIAYGLSGNITLMNMETREKRELFTGEAAARYSYIYWNLGWSHDSKSIAFQGRLRQAGGDELVVADIDEPNKFQVILPEATGINHDYTFTPDNRSVLFSKSSPEYRGPQLYLIHRNSPGELELLKGQPTDRKILNCAWSHDGKLIAFTCNLDPVPVDWHQQPERD